MNSTTSFPYTTTSFSSQLNITSTHHGNITTYLVDDSNHGNITHVIASAFCLIVLLIGTIGNTLVLVIFGSRWQRLKSFEKYLVSLASADLIATTVFPTLLLYEHIGGSFSRFYDPGCYVVFFVIRSSIAISAYTLVVITIDRYKAIKWPLRQQRSNCLIKCDILMTWAVGMLLVASLEIFDNKLFLRLDDSGVGMYCDQTFTNKFTNKRDKKIYNALLMVFQGGFPLVLLTFLNGLLLFEINKSVNAHFTHNDQLLRTRMRRNKKATNLLIVTVIVFLLSVTPTNVVQLAGIFDPAFQVSDRTHAILEMLFLVNSCANSIIYAKMHKSFRHNVIRIITSCLCQQICEIRFVKSFSTTVRSAFSETSSDDKMGLKKLRDRSSEDEMKKLRDRHTYNRKTISNRKTIRLDKVEMQVLQ